MARLVIFCLWAVLGTVWGDALFHLTGKPLVRGKVFGRGVSVTAKTLSQCMDACTANSTTCDGIVFHQVIGKCRLISKCGSALQIDNSTTSVYYSKRPIIKSDGFLYISNSDSCVGYLSASTDYADADRNCAERNGRLALVESRRASIVASKLLSRAQRDWAWIGENKSGNRVAAPDGFVPDVMNQTDDGTLGRNCWAINYKQEWAKFPCKNHTLPALCEILPFPV